MQDAAEQAVAAGIARLNRPGLQAALVALDPLTGDVLAMVGGSNYLTSTFNRATRTRRQAGSAFKPIVYAAALREGLSPVSMLSDLDRIVAPQDPDWRPRPAGNRSADRSEVALRDALAESDNAAAAVLQQRIGSRRVLLLAAQSGLRDLPDVPSLALGAGSVSPIDLTAAYSMFPGRGWVVKPRGMLTVYDADGDRVFDRPVQRSRVLSEPVSFQMVSMLREVVDRGTGSAARGYGAVGPLGSKTGTTDDYVDAWFVGFSSATVAGVWVGFDTPAPIGREAYAARVALPIWADFMKRTARVRPAREFPIPSGLRAEELCRVSRLKPLDRCPTYTEYFKEGDAVPDKLCPEHGGSLRQVAARALQDVLRAVGHQIGAIFR